MLSLSSLLPELSDANVSITGLSDDSRKAQAGDLFIAVSGEHYSAEQMLSDVKGLSLAAAVHDSSEHMDAQTTENFPLFSVKDLPRRRGEIASEYYQHPSEDMFVVAITGTNGKTSCSQYIANALEEKCGVVGTMGWGLVDDLVEPGLTTPDALRLQQLLSKLKNKSAEAVCLEASSHGLVQDRLKGVRVDVAVLTNLTRDHLDYHGSLQAYKDAKKMLFQMDGLKTAVLNADDSFSAEVAKVLEAGVNVVRYSLDSSDADVYFSEIEFSTDGISGTVTSPWGLIGIQSSLIGGFNAQNLLAVISVLGCYGYNAARISQRVSGLSNVRGRMDRIALQNGAIAVIDYAHTPDALESALAALTMHTSARLICVMGCGGDRDQGKRPLMGEISSRLADVTIVTDDNPRTEASALIIQQIMAGVDNDSTVIIESNRAQAIRTALGSAKSGDVILIAGKGHEDYQEISGVRHHFSDHEIVHEFLNVTRSKVQGLKPSPGAGSKHESRGS